MKSPALVCVVSIVSAMSVAASALAGRVFDHDAHANRFDRYSDQPSRRVPYTAYGDRPSELGGRNGVGEPGFEPEWNRAPFGVAPNRVPWSEPRVDRFPGGAYGGNPSPYNQAPYRGEDWVRWQDAAAAWEAPNPDSFTIHGEQSPVSAQGYRFRGDNPVGFGGWEAGPHGKGYRFRPLTEQERRRVGSGAAWPGAGPVPGGDWSRRPDLPPFREAQGYWSENWFNRY